ncbi:MAG: hypothetical protein HC882_00830 [Acidobacteria bacterium]|nr:hypothetical protein [Acidobacteriota bacterium]
MIELCAGTAAVSLAASGSSRFPVSRIGSKAGYVEPILEACGWWRTRFFLCEIDPSLISIWHALLDTQGVGYREATAHEIEMTLGLDARGVWEWAREGVRTCPSPSASDVLLWMAGARGGIGGFKGLHKLRPNVDGFIPSRESLVERIRTFRTSGLRMHYGNASDLDPAAFVKDVVYIDPPYVGRQGYGWCLREPVEGIAERWRAAGHKVVVSEGRPLPGADEHRNITRHRKGQSRRSLTTNQEEWLSIWKP